MQILITLIALTNAYAAPQVGDTALYDMLLRETEGVVPYSEQHEIVKIDTDGTFQVKITRITNGKTTETKEWVESIMDREEGAAWAKDCQGGVKETVEVPAGKFETCRVKGPADAGGPVYWFGAVPFGIVKAQTGDGQRGVSVQLKAFK